jgi:two-component sensor histidine kinase
MGKKLEAINYIENMMDKYPPKTMTDSITYLQRIGHAYRELKRFPEAESYFLRVSAILKKHHLNPGDINLDLGSLYLDAHQYEKARIFLYGELSAPYRSYTKGGQRQLHYMLFLADSATHHYLSAIKHQNFLNNKAEFKLRKDRDSVVKTMEVAYKALEKEQEIKLNNQNIARLKQQAVAQQEKLKQSQKISLLTAGALLLSLVVLMLFYFLYRQNRQSNKEMSHKNQLLYKLVSEKEWLLKEVHHRVKNNLHTVFCLLESQARTATKEARSALEKSQLRIYAMSLFHQKVYQSENIEQVDFGFYIRDFLVFLHDSFDMEARNIRITQHLAPVSLSLKQAMPLALVANEALTNAAKYAFEGRSSGEIRITLEKQNQSHLLTISDDGTGIPAECFSVNRSLGMELMHGLCADIGAAISFEIENGTKICISFVVEQVSERPEEYQEI